MKKLFLTTLMIASLLATFAQQDPNAKDILDKLSVKTNSYNTIKADFEIDYNNINDNTHNSSKGTIVIKGDKYRLNFMGSESFFNGETLWSYLKEVKEVNITTPNPDDEDIFSNPKTIFTIYEKGFKYQLVDKTNEKGTNYSVVDLFPENLEEEYSRIRLVINTDSYFLSSATIFGKEGSHYIISIKNFKSNVDFDDSYFTFNPANYPDVEIIDMRL